MESGDGYEVTSYTGTDAKVYIPATYESLPVTTIGNSAFFRRTNLTEVVIPDSVTTIANSAFSRCTGLTKIVIPDSVTTIGEYAFDYCNNLTIYCKMESKPSGWDSNWNSSNRPVVWGYTGE